MAICDLVLPCRDEAPALDVLLPRVPGLFEIIVVDNGSADATAEVARRHGARVVRESVAGYGAAVRAGVAAARAEFVAVMDADGSLDPHDLLPLLEDVRSGRADLAGGRRRPVRRGVWPWHARLGNAMVVALLHRQIGYRLHDLPAMRVCRRRALLTLDVGDPRFGYPVELVRRAVLAGWCLVERDVRYSPRTAGTRSKVSGSLLGTIRTTKDFRKALS